jgi:CAAX amino terminal protease family.
MEKKFPWTVIVISVASCLLLFIVEQIIGAPYIVKSAVKIFLFLIVPLRFVKKGGLLPDKAGFRHPGGDRKKRRISLLLGWLSMSGIVIIYFLFSPFIDGEAIIDDLVNRVQVTRSVFLFVALYITFGNSFLEEWYFRGFIFKQLHGMGRRRWAYIYSASLFSLYHGAIFALWFHWWVMLLALFGLFLVGLLFNYLNEGVETILNSWIVHVFADAGVMAIGFYLFATLG